MILEVGGRVSTWSVVHMALALAGCRMDVTSTGWTISTLFVQMDIETTHLP